MRNQEMLITSDMDLKQILLDIYKKIFCGFKEEFIVVFLCGGASKRGKKSLRDQVRPMLENEKRRYNLNKPFKVFYPEDLLIDILNRTSNADLLTYEQFLAQNSHMIVIVCESPGALVELGAFSNNDYTSSKVIAAIDRKRKKDKSFIMLGPIKYLKKKNRLNIVEYGKETEIFAKRLSKNIREKCRENAEQNSMISLSTIVGLHYFIQLLLYCFKTINSKDLSEMIKYVAQEVGVNLKDFNVLFFASLKLLFQDEKIVKTIEQPYSFYQLTQKGYKTMEKMISSCTINGECDKIRVKIMYYEFYKSPRS